MTRRFLRLKQIIGTRDEPGRIPISKSSWWLGVKNRHFPQPVKLGPRTTVWYEDEVDAIGDLVKKHEEE
jgi:predicted DNA-binding transcriptional regulator AlpA